MKIVDDFLVDKGKESFVGILIILGKNKLWIFNTPVHGSYLAFGEDPKIKRMQRW